jgi:HK97 gp10 family phage protein
MAKVKFKVEGLSELLEGLRELPKATGTNALKRALIAAAGPMESTAKSLAPYLTGLLRERIDVGTKLSSRQRALSKKESKVEVYIGPPSMPRAIVAEFGSVKQTPHPFMRPAWDQHKMEAFDSIKENLKGEIEKARQRIARKQARLLAQMKT